MKFDETQVGGTDVDPFLFQWRGDEVTARSHIYQARIMLGELKQQMELGALPSGVSRKRMRDGSVVRVTVAKGDGDVTQDISTVFVDTVPTASDDEAGAGAGTAEETPYAFVSAIFVINSNAWTDDDLGIYWNGELAAYVDEQYLGGPGDSVRRSVWITPTSVTVPTSTVMFYVSGAYVELTVEQFYTSLSNVPIQIRNMHSDLLLVKAAGIDTLSVATLKNNGEGNYGKIAAFNYTAGKLWQIQNAVYSGTPATITANTFIPDLAGWPGYVG